MSDPCLIETGGALNIGYRGRLLYSERDPVSFPRRAVLACETGPGRLYLVLSPGLWYGLPELLSRLEPGSAVLCLEAEPELARLSRDRMPEEIAEAISGGLSLGFLDSAEPERVKARARELGRFRRCVTLRLSGGESFHSREYAAAAALLQSEFAAYWRSKAALMSMGRLWARNIFRNLARLSEIAPEPLPSFDSPAIVCGAGPSLERAIPFMAANRDKLALLACDTALGLLVESGLEPDLVVCLEGQAHNLADFTSSAGRKIGLVADLSSHPATFGILGGSNHLSAVEIVSSPFLDRVGKLGIPSLPCPPLGSVGVHAVHIARRIARGPIFVSGLDFSYERGKTHARGSPSPEAERRRMTRLSRWQGQTSSAFRKGLEALPDGRLTDPALSAYAALLVDEARRPGPPLLDIRGGGLPIAARTLSLEDAEAALEGQSSRGLLMQGQSSLAARRAPAPCFHQAVEDFFKLEISRLDLIYKVLKGQTFIGGDELLRLIAEADYLLWPLPDSERLEARRRDRPQDLFNRILVEVEYWLWKVEELEESF